MVETKLCEIWSHMPCPFSTCPTIMGHLHSIFGGPPSFAWKKQRAQWLGQQESSTTQSCHAYKGAPGLSYRNRSQIESGQPERRKGQSQGNPFPEMVNLSLFHGLISSYGPMTFLHSDLVWGDDSRTSQDFTPLLAGSASSLERFRPGRTALTESLPGAVILGSSIDSSSNCQNPSVGKVP